MWKRIKRVFSGAQPPPKVDTPANAANETASTHFVDPRKSNPQPRRFSLPYFHQSTSLAPATTTHFNFMGNGVSYAASDVTSDVDELNRLGLPMLRYGDELAQAIGFSPQRLRWLAFHNERVRSCNYFFFEVPKRDGSQRKLAAPRIQIDACARWILNNILNKVPAHPSSHGFVKSRSILTNAKVHSNQAVVVNLDLQNFFNTIEFRRVRGLFHSFGYSGQVATILALLSTEAPRKEIASESGTMWEALGPRHLPQGARTSPAISNLICRTLDRRLSGLCRAISWKYTRYADDLTFSCGAESTKQIGYLLHRIRGIVRDEGFEVNERKTRVQRQSQAQEVTGLVVNEKPGVPRKEIRLIRAILFNASKHGLESQNREGRKDFVAWLEGKIGFISQAHPMLGSKLHSQLRQLKSETMSDSDAN